MKTMILATAAVLALGAGSAYADARAGTVANSWFTELPGRGCPGAGAAGAQRGCPEPAAARRPRLSSPAIARGPGCSSPTRAMVDQTK